jgi:hypothetical protein
MFLLMVAFAYFGYRYTQKQNEALKQNRSPSLNASLLGDNHPAEKRIYPKRGNTSLFYSPTTLVPTVVIYWLLMLTHTFMVQWGLIAFWDK